MIVALKKLGEELTPAELHILETSDDAMRQFESADKAIGEGWLCAMRYYTAVSVISRDNQVILCCPSLAQA